MTTMRGDTSYTAVHSYNLKNIITRNKNTRKIGDNRKKQIPNIKFVSNNNREVRWVS